MSVNFMRKSFSVLDPYLWHMNPSGVRYLAMIELATRIILEIILVERKTLWTLLGPRD